MSLSNDIAHLHEIYCQVTGFDIPLAYGRERAWYDYVKAGYNEKDLHLVVLHLKHRIRRKERQPACLKFSNLIDQIDRFEEDLALARTTARNPRVTNKTKEVRLLRPVVKDDLAVSDNVRTSKEVIGKLAEELRRAAGGG